MLFETAINHLNESPDKVRIDNPDDGNFIKLYYDADGVTFVVIADMYFQSANIDEDEYSIHAEIYTNMRLITNKIGNNIKEFIRELELHRIDYYNVTQQNYDKLLTWYSKHSTRSANIRHEFDIAGRMWTNNYIIAFWKRAKDMKPSDVNLMMEAIPKLNPKITDASKLKVNPIEDGEILVNIKEYLKTSQPPTKPSLSDAEIKALQQKQHLDPNAKKQLIGTSSGIGSSKLSNISAKAGFKTAAEYNAKSRTSESNLAFSNMFNKFLTEDPDDLYAITNLETEKSFQSHDAVTFAVIKGMYFQYDRPTYSEMLPITHQDIIEALQSACRSKKNLYNTFMRKIKITNLHSFNVTEERLQELKKVIYMPEKGQLEVEREVFKLSGRLWTDVNIIAFWQTRNQISNEDLSVLKIAIPMFNKSVLNIKQLQVNPMEDDEKLIPFDEYFNSNKIVSKYTDAEIKALQQKQHFDPEAKKKLIGTNSGIGSSKYANIANKAGYKSTAEFTNIHKIGESKFASIFKLVL